MWHKRFNGNVESSNSINHTLNFLWQRDNLYIMDNHLAAGWCWLNSLSRDKQYCFFHVDQHEDLCAGLATLDYLVQIKNSYPFDIDTYCDFTVSEGKNIPKYPYNKVFLWNTYIKQIQYMYPKWFSECYFACSNEVSENPRSTILKFDTIINKSNLEVYNSIKYWVCSEPNRQWIFNLDLDYFFDNDYMRIYSDDYIKAFAQNLYEALDNIAVLTIAMSPECCGGWQKAIRVLEIFSKVFDLNEVLDSFTTSTL